MHSYDIVHWPGRARLEADATARTARAWPPLPLSKWQQTRDTLQLWLQVVGKVRLQSSPLLNHWWNVPLYLTSRGLTTSLMQHPSGESFQMDLDFHEHRLDITTVSGSQRAMALEPMPVREFYRSLMALLDDSDGAGRADPQPAVSGDQRAMDSRVSFARA